jgi:hypothetical protein
MIVSSRYLFLGAACMLAATIVACDKNQSAPSSTPSPSPAPAPAPAPAPSPGATTFTVTGTVAETSPTADRMLDGVTITLGDRTVLTDGAGRFSIADLPVGGYILSVSKGGYSSQSVGVTLPNDAAQVFRFNLQPQADSRTDERSGRLSQDNNPCAEGAFPCFRLDWPSHHELDVEATLLWPSSDATLRLELRCGGELIASQTERGEGSISRNGEDYLYMELTGRSHSGQFCEVRALHINGPEQRVTLVVSHGN